MTENYTLRSLKEFRERNWDESLPINEAYTKYVNMFNKLHKSGVDTLMLKSQVESMVKQMLEEIKENYSASGCKSIIKSIAKENGVEVK